jgi:anaerobic magnesium-protoporphyrin IX monomethyl ester cyclase
MDILLIDPPYSSLKGVSTDCGYNVALTSLAAYLRNGGIENGVLMGDLLMDFPSSDGWLNTSLEDYASAAQDYQKIVNDKSHIIWKKLSDIVRQSNPIAVGISYLTPLRCVVEKVASLTKEVNPDIKVVIGSCHPTFCPDEVMQNPNIDFVIRGEGEIPLLSLAKELKKPKPKWETVPGIYYRDNDKQVKLNTGVNLLQDLDNLPFLARDLVLNSNYDIYRVHCLSTARGCPYLCSFCADKRLWGGKVRRRSVESVIKELKLIEDTYKVNSVDFDDGTFTYDKKYLQTFCNTVISEKLSLNWRCTARYDNLDKNLLQLMKRANCSGLYFGLESGSDRILKAINKNTTVKQIIKVSEMVYDSGIQSVTSVLLGLPNEGKEDMEATLKLMATIKTDIFDVNSYVPLPGSPLWDSMTEDEKKNIDWRKTAYKSYDNYFSKNVSHDDLKRYLSQAYEIANDVQKKTIARFGANNNSGQ